MAALEQADAPQRIAAFVSEASGEARVRAENLVRLAGGSSKQVWAVDVTLGGETLALALRINPNPAAPGEGFAAQSGGFEGEFRLLQAMHRRGAPVPKVYWTCLERDLLGGPFYLMDRIEGETIPRRILRSDALLDGRAKLPEQLGRAIARIHAADLVADELEWLPGPPAGQSSPQSQVAQIRAGIDLHPEPLPATELAFRFLEQNMPDERDRTLVHGDFRMGNIIVGAEGLRAVLDWELAHVGDPHEDLAWMCTKTWRFGQVDQPVGGVGQREPFYRAYEAESGRKLDRAALRYWELLCSAKVVCVWILQVRAYLTGTNPSVEQAAIGRRIAETELDLLELIRES
jgi:aminoglycoside phosphotransferase (APT) family kinase protein